MRKRDFEKFYLENIDKIYRFVFFRVGRDRELAEDLVSEIFIKALNSFAVYDRAISRSAWLYAIAKNHLANHWRDQKINQPIPELEADESADQFWLTLAAGKFQDAQLNNRLYELLNNLDQRERDIVTLHYLSGYSYIEIAEIMGEMTEGAVKVAAHRALKKLRSIV